METAVSIMVIVFVVGVVFCVEMLMFRKPLTEKEISSYQKTLNKISASLNENHGIESSYDSKTELLKSRNQEKSLVLILAGVMIVLFLFVLILAGVLSFTNIAVMCISAIMLIVYGVIKMAESKKLAVGILSFIFIFGTLAKIAFDKAMEMSPSAYLYLCAIILLIGAFSLFGEVLKRV